MFKETACFERQNFEREQHTVVLLKIHPVNKFNHWPVNTIWYYVVAR
jgi:hypothetical protein